MNREAGAASAVAPVIWLQKTFEVASNLSNLSKDSSNLSKDIKTKDKKLSQTCFKVHITS